VQPPWAKASAGIDDLTVSIRVANRTWSFVMNPDCAEITRLENTARSDDPIEAAQARTALTALVNQIRADRNRMAALHRDCPDLAMSNDVPRPTAHPDGSHP
jgi:hypothetical protein